MDTANNCEFHLFLESHDLEADRKNFPDVISQRTDSRIEYELALFAKCRFQAKGALRSQRSILKYGVQLNYCPECGRIIDRSLCANGDLPKI